MSGRGEKIVRTAATDKTGFESLTFPIAGREGGRSRAGDSHSNPNAKAVFRK